MTALDDAFARLRATRGAVDRTHAAACGLKHTHDAPRGAHRRAAIEETQRRRILAFWRAGRHHTAAIAAELGIPEHEVCRTIRAHRVPA